MERVREAVNNAADELAPMGGLLHVTKMEQREELVQAVVNFYCQGRIEAALQQ